MFRHTTNERRRSLRKARSVYFRFVHKESHREFPARTVDISCSGMLISAPARSPLKVGQGVILKLTPRHSPKRHIARNLPAKVVRVDHDALLTTGHLKVGLAFEELQDNDDI